jgi:hypothetical protein
MPSLALLQILTKVLKLTRYGLVETLQCPVPSEGVGTGPLFEGFVMDVGAADSFQAFQGSPGDNMFRRNVSPEVTKQLHVLWHHRDPTCVQGETIPVRQHT